MDICIYFKYKVLIKQQYSVLYEYKDNWEFIDNECEEILNGNELIKKITNNLKDDEINEIIVHKDSIEFSFFNPLTGESGETIYEIEQIQERDK